MDGEIIATRRVEERPKEMMMSKILLSFTVLGKPLKIHIEFKDPVPISEMPKTVLEAPEENLLEELESQIWVDTRQGIATIEEIAIIEEVDDDEDE